MSSNGALAGKLRSFRYWPEVVSFLTGSTAPYAIEFIFEEYMWRFFRPFLWRIPTAAYWTLGAVVILLGTAFCAVLYFLAKRPSMWRHVILYLSGILAHSFLAQGWPETVSLLAFISVIIAIPASLVCLIYAIIFDTDTTKGGKN